MKIFLSTGEEKNDFLSIGEVARLKRIPTKALRYYEKLGIFLPDHINAETGYRYYRLDQMVFLDFILVCLELGIPLKNFSNYLVDQKDTLDIDLLVKDGIAIAEQAAVRIRQTTDKLKNMSRHLSESEALPDVGVSYTRRLPERYLLLQTMPQPFPTHKQYISALTDLYFRMEAGGYTNFYGQGLLFQMQDGQPVCCVFNEIQQPEHPAAEVRILPSAEYTCCCMERKPGNAWEKHMVPMIQALPEGQCLILQERYKRYFSDEPIWELQNLPITLC